jgi:hypothetical protein
MPKKPKGGRRNKSWEKIKADYVTDPGLSLKKVAEKYGVPLRTVAQHSKAENWFATKQEHQEQYCNELASKLHQKKADTLEQELMAALNFSDRLLKVLEDDPEQFNRHLIVTTVSDAEGLTTTTDEKTFDKLDMRAMKDAVSVLKTIEELKRSILGIQTIENLQKHQLERDRFEFEKQKADFNKPDSNNSIRIEGFEKGWAE